MKSHKPNHVQRQSVTHCERCGKATFADRKTARRSARNGRTTAERLREYRCPHNVAHWHIGHLPRDVVRDRRTIDQVYR